MKRTNEVMNCFEKYFDGETNAIINNTSKEFSEKFFSNIENIIIRDNPDCYIKFDDFTLIIDHFEYDATQNSKKGSEALREENRILNAKNNSIREKMNITYNTTTLVNNFLKHFNNHKDKISQYKKELINESIIGENTKIKFMLICEDTTFFGCNAYDNNEKYYFSIIDIKEIIDEIRKSNVDYILLLNSHEDYKTVNLFSNNDDIYKYSKNKSKEEISMIDYSTYIIKLSL